jgi:hypothetical protein
VTFRGRVDHHNSQYALYAAACMRGRLQPDFLGDTGWWQTPLWQYAVYALVIFSRAVTERFASLLDVSRAGSDGGSHPPEGRESWRQCQPPDVNGVAGRP